MTQISNRIERRCSNPSCKKELKSWEAVQCTSCKDSFNVEGFEKAINENAKSYTNYLANQEARSQSGAPTNHATGQPKPPENKRVPTAQEWYDEMYNGIGAD